MANAKEEFIEHIKGRKVLCAFIEFGCNYSEDPKQRHVLKKGYTDSDLSCFLNNLNFEYDDSFGTQELYGTIWYSDGTYSDRREYDGSEWWEHQVIPKIPEECN